MVVGEVLHVYTSFTPQTDTIWCSAENSLKSLKSGGSSGPEPTPRVAPESPGARSWPELGAQLQLSGNTPLMESKKKLLKLKHKYGSVGKV